MIYSLQCYIITNNNGIRSVFKGAVPRRDDSRIHHAGYVNADSMLGDTKILHCNIGFNAESDRDEITILIKKLAGIIHSCEKGSKIVEYKSWHDEAIDGVPPRPCEQQTILRKE